ncbi:hypothetical protein [Actinopolymorpha pittospori]
MTEQGETVSAAVPEGASGTEPVTGAAGESRWLRWGLLADGLFKILVGAAYLLLLPLVSRELGAPGWLVLVAAVLVLLSGLAEALFALHRDPRRHIRYLIAYDSGWALVTVFCLLLALAGFGGGGLAGSAWLAVQALGSAVLAAVFLAGIHRGTRLTPRSAADSSSRPGR